MRHFAATFAKSDGLDRRQDADTNCKSSVILAQIPWICVFEDQPGWNFELRLIMPTVASANAQAQNAETELVNRISATLRDIERCSRYSISV